MGRYTKREHALGPYWLDKRANSPAYCICWMEGRQLRRQSTGTADLDAAIQALKAHYLAGDTPDLQDVTRVPIADVLNAYYLQHGQHITSKKWIAYAVAHWVRFYGETTSVWAATRPARIERFIDDLRAHGLKPSSINTVLTAGRAATGRAWKRGELTRQIHVPSVKVTRMEPKGRPLSVEECAAWLDASAPHFHALLYVCLATGSRPEAVKELRWAQVDFDDGLLHLNPEDREQTSKRRPVVRMPPSLVEYLRQIPRESDHVVSFRGQPVDRYYTALGESRRRAGLDERVNLYSARHTVARWLRKQRVPFEEVAGQLGHRVPGFAITEIYAAYSPDFQALATAAIEQLLQAIATHKGLYGGADLGRRRALQTSERWDESVTEHRASSQALVARDAARADALQSDHVGRMGTVVLKHLASTHRSVGSARIIGAVDSPENNQSGNGRPAVSRASRIVGRPIS